MSHGIHESFNTPKFIAHKLTWRWRLRLRKRRHVVGAAVAIFAPYTAVTLFSLFSVRFFAFSDSLFWCRYRCFGGAVANCRWEHIVAFNLHSIHIAECSFTFFNRWIESVVHGARVLLCIEYCIHQTKSTNKIEKTSFYFIFQMVFPSSSSSPFYAFWNSVAFLRLHVSSHTD